MVKCKLCRKMCNAITNTHLRQHGVSLNAYKLAYGNVTSDETRRKQSESGKGKNQGKHRPDARERMKTQNPMKDKTVSRKMGETRKRHIASGQIDGKQLIKNIKNLPTDNEKEVIRIFKELNFPLKYVGDGSLFIDSHCPDFICEELRIAVELDLNENMGNAHMQAQQSRRKDFLRHGYLLVFLMTKDKQKIKGWLTPFFSAPTWKVIKEIKQEPIADNHCVYNLTIEPNNNYFANGILAHNCFAYFFKSNNPGIKQVQLKSINTDRMIKAISGKPEVSRDRMLHKHFYSRKFLLHWGGLADPFDSFEKHNNIGLKLIEALGDFNYPTLFSSKGATILDRQYMHVFEKYSSQKNFAFQTSIITNSDKLSNTVEIGVPPTSQRLRILKTFSDMGYWTILRLRPFIIGISDMELEELLGRALEAGIRGVSMEFFAMDGRANVGMKSRYEWLAKVMGVKDLHQYFKALSPSERGGYMRLNRLVKEQYVKTVYKFCAQHKLVCGISDPDFKELNTSGSCCAMPDNYPENRLLENWTRSQLTYHTKEARRLYHKTGQIKELLFHEVYGNESYLDEVAFTNDHVGTVGMCTADAKYLTLRTMLQRHWNNLGSPPNPRNYLHGKVMPTRSDENGNLVYSYNPMEYEDRWKREGIDLTR